MLKSPPPGAFSFKGRAQRRPQSPQFNFTTRKGATLIPSERLVGPRDATFYSISQNQDATISYAALASENPLNSLIFTLEAPKSKSNVSLYQELLHDVHLWAQNLPIGVRRLAAGGIAGAIAKTATAPLEAIKLKVVQGKIGTFQAVSLLYTNGFPAFFRGNGLDVLRTVPAKAGALAGILSTVAVHPLETVRTRLAVGTGACGVNGGGALACSLSIVRQEGIGALFRGLDASIVGIMPYAAIRLGTYDAMKRAYKRRTKSDHVSPQAALVFGGIAGVVSAVATFPLEVARRRMMAGGPYKNLIGALMNIVSNEGVGALFRGVELMVVKQMPQYALSFATYEQAKRALAL